MQSLHHRALAEHTPNSAGATTSAPEAAGRAALTPEAFLRARWGDGDGLPGHVVVWRLEDERSQWFPVRELAAAGRALAELAAAHNGYVGMALQDQAAALAEAAERERKAAERAKRAPRPIRPEYVRGYSSTSLAVAGFWYEVDIGGPDHAGAHKKANLPRSVDEALEVVDGFPLRPTDVIFSGHGIQGHWLFHEPWVFETAEERERAQDLLWRFQQTLHTRMTARGWEWDATHDFARVLRPWGTVNRKPGLEPVPVRALRRDDSARYSPDDFEPYLLDPDAIRAKGQAEPVALPDDLAPVDVQDLPLPRRIREAIETGRYVDAETHEDRAPSSSERTWHIVNAMLEFGQPDETIASVFLDPRYRIGDRVREKRGGGRAWIAAEIGRARAHQQRKAEREPKAPEIIFTPKGSDGAAGDLVEQLRAEVARLRRRSIDQDDRIEELEALVGFQANVIGTQRRDLQSALDREAAVRELVAVPAERMSPTDKLWWLANAPTLALARVLDPEGERDGWAPLSLAGSAAIMGVSEDTVSKTAKRYAEGAGALLERHLTRTPKLGADGLRMKDERGKPVWVSELRVRTRDPAATDEAGIWRTVARYTPETERNHGGKRARVCPACGPDAGITVTWSCADCGKVLDRRDPLKPQDADSEPSIPAAVDGPSSTPQDAVSESPVPAGLFDPDAYVTAAVATQLGSDRTNGDYARANRTNGHAEVPTLQIKPTPATNGHAVEHPPLPSRWQCRCLSFERRYRERFEDWVCDGCGVTAPAPGVPR